MRKTALLLLLSAAVLNAAVPDNRVPTFSRDIAPILQDNCQVCHRPGEIAPFPLLTYKQARPYAAAIKEAVTLRKMPPWFADPKYGHFSNARSLSQQQIDTLVAWAKSGALEGDPRDLPPPRHFVDGWNIEHPDQVLSMPVPYYVPPSGTIEYTYELVPAHFDKDTWVQMAEIRPANHPLFTT
ncbi:MAG: cytochrome c [Acidobacteriota bacterium]|nr:cytochrome c [Acidobacteriota bacterium]